MHVLPQHSRRRHSAERRRIAVNDTQGQKENEIGPGLVLGHILHDTDIMSERGIWAGHLRESYNKHSWNYIFMAPLIAPRDLCKVPPSVKFWYSPPVHQTVTTLYMGSYIITQATFLPSPSVGPCRKLLRAKSCRLADQQICDCLTGLGSSFQAKPSSSSYQHHHPVPSLNKHDKHERSWPWGTARRPQAWLWLPQR